MKIIGLCGMSGSGKGYVCNIFERYGIPSIDTDAVYRDILKDTDSPCLFELKSAFGDGIIQSDGSLDRKKLADIVFSDGEKLELLNKITHKYIRKKTDELIEKYKIDGADAVIIDAPVLFESGFNKMCDITVCVTCDTETAVRRITERDGISADKAHERLSKQIKPESLRELCDFEIVNGYGCDVEIYVCQFIKKFLK